MIYRDIDFSDSPYWMYEAFQKIDGMLEDVSDFVYYKQTIPTGSGRTIFCMKAIHHMSKMAHSNGPWSFYYVGNNNFRVDSFNRCYLNRYGNPISYSTIDARVINGSISIPNRDSIFFVDGVKYDNMLERLSDLMSTGKMGRYVVLS